MPLPTETPNAGALDPATTIIDARGCLTPIEFGAYQLMWSLIDRIRGLITPLAFCFVYKAAQCSADDSRSKWNILTGRCAHYIHRYVGVNEW